jgi:UDP-N-acetylglucosamine:LPS N-acetylglucosamine transferase
MDIIPQRTLEFVYFDAGGGHRSAATALKKVIEEHYPHWEVRLTNLQELLQPVDPVFRLTKVSSENVYNSIIKRGWTYGSEFLLRAVQKWIEKRAPLLEAVLREHWHKSDADLVVSLIPNFNGVMFRALKAVQPSIPYVTVMTDIADCPPHFWQEKQEQYLVCGSDRAAEQALEKGYRSDRVFKVSGMILKPDFYVQQDIDRRARLKELDLDPDLPTALIMFGGNGSRESVKILRRLKKSKFAVQSIVMCGNNKKLRKQLSGRKNCHPVGYTSAVAEYMRLADFFIGKPGPGSISEALHSGLPVIIERSKRTMPQERYNTDWVKTHGVGIVVKSFRKTSKAVGKLLEGDTLALIKNQTGNLHNNAVFEIPKILDQIMVQNKTEPEPTLYERPVSPANTPIARSVHQLRRFRS